MSDNRMVVDSVKISQLFKWIEEGQFALPQLQRGFVWNGKKAAKLFDSIYRQMPIGTPVIWVAESEMRWHIRENLHILKPFNHQHEQVYFILDGQQRISTIYRSFIGDIPKLTGKRKVDFGQVVFRLKESDSEPEFAYRKPVLGHWMPLHQLLGGSWRAYVKGYGTDVRKRASHCRKVLLNYSMPFIAFGSDHLEEVQDLFVRINSLGTRISAADEVFSKATSMDLRAVVEKTISSLPQAHGFTELEPMPLLALLGVLQGAADIRKQAIDVQMRRLQREFSNDPSKKDAFANDWKHIETAIQRASKHLIDHLGVEKFSHLPSSYMVVVIAAYFHSRRGNVPAEHARQIERWFWVTGLCSRYSGRGYYQNIIADIGRFQKLAVNEIDDLPFTETISPKVFLKSDYRDTKSLAKTYICLLFANRPRFLDTGQVMGPADTLAFADRQHRHHAFPRSLLQWEEVPEQKINCLLNICLLGGAENLAISNTPPSEYLAEYEGKGFVATMKSHLLPAHKGAGVWHEELVPGFEQFLLERLELIVSELTRRTGLKNLFKED